MQRGNKGFTVLEMAIAGAFFIIMIGAVLVSLDRAARLYAHGVTQADLQVQAIKAMGQMVKELRNAGFIVIDESQPNPYYNGNMYPYVVVTEGYASAAGEYWWKHDHYPAQHQAEPGDPAYGPTREVIFKTPWNTDGSWADYDMDGFPLDASTGAIEWSSEEISYVLVTDPTGTNVLQRRVNGATPRVLARHVERVTFDTQYSDPTVNAHQIVISLYLTQTTKHGRTLSASIVSSVNMRNAGEVK